MNGFNTSLTTAFVAFIIGSLMSPLTHRGAPERQPDPFVSPGPSSLAFAALEHHNGWSDWVWLEAIQRIGGKGPVTDPHHYERIAGLSAIATDLDPRYWGVYDASATYISAYSGKADLSDKILAKGQKRLPLVWRFPFMMGWNDYFIRGLAQQAAQHWRTAATLPEAPIYLGSLSGRALRQGSGNVEASIQFLASMLEHIDDPRQQKFIMERIAILRSETILNAYDEACEQYRLNEGVFPESAGSLFLMGMVSYAPQDKLGSPITLDTSEGKCIARSEIIKVREDEAAQRIGKFRRQNIMESKDSQVHVNKE